MSITINPQFSIEFIAILAAIVIVACVLLAVVRLASVLQTFLRLCVFSGLIALLLNPVYISEETEDLPNIGLIIVDKTASQSLGDRETFTQKAQEFFDTLNIPNLELSYSVVEGNARTDLLQALEQARQSTPDRQLSAAVLVTDGQVHDASFVQDFPVPVHVLLTGNREDFDVSVEFIDVPSYAIVDKEFSVKARVVYSGNTDSQPPAFELSILHNNTVLKKSTVQDGQVIDVPVTLTARGKSLLQASVTAIDSELTTKNNQVYKEINTIQDRLRVLLVSGEPYAGSRSLRSLIKSDPTVDLVHFSILRPPSKPSLTPVDELSLIEFPVQELFEEKLDQFDLVIFDRYQRQGILPLAYFSNISSYVKNGGSLMIIADESFSEINSIANSPLEEILPASPKFIFYEKPFVPTLTKMGEHHPVTRSLQFGTPNWARWYKFVELMPAENAQILMTADNAPLFLLRRVDKGRVALLGSDNSWLWARNLDSGGPYGALMRRTAHWLMQEPELEEEQLSLKSNPESISVVRSTIQTAQEMPEVELIKPDKSSEAVRLVQMSESVWEANVPVQDEGIYIAKQNNLTAYTAFPQGTYTSETPEYKNVIGTQELLEPIIQKTSGKIVWLQDSEIASVNLVNSPLKTSTHLEFLDRGARKVIGKDSFQIFSTERGLLFFVLLVAILWLIEAGRLRLRN